MSRAGIWFVLSCKRYMKRLSFLMILLILPLAVRGIRTAQESGGTQVRVAVYAEGMERSRQDEAEVYAEGMEQTEHEATEQAQMELPLEHKLAQRLVSGAPGQEDSIFSFYLSESEQQVKDQVASKRAECGYVIAQGLREKLENKNYKRSIRVYSAPSTVAAGLSTEVVFAALMELYDQELFVDFVENDAAFDEIAPAGSLRREELARQAGSLYETWLYNGSTFHFAAETAGSSGDEGGRPETGTVKPGEQNPPKESDGVFPVRGIVAVYIFIIGLYAAVMNLTDEARGLFLAVPYNCRTACRTASLAAPVFLAAASGMAALLSGGVMTGAGKELSAMLLYAAAVTGFAWALRVTVRRPEVICGLIPFFLMGSLLFCPVIIDAGRYIPALKEVQKLFLPWYYLKYFV